VADTITWETLRELASFRAAKGRAISVYLSLDPSEVPTPADTQTRMHSVLDGAQRQLHERRDSLGHEEREALKADLERVRSWFDHEFDRGGARGIAVFAAGLDNLWQQVVLADPVEDRACVDRELYLTPLIPLVGRPEGTLVAYVGRERADLYRLRKGRLVEVADQTEEVPGRHDQGGWSQARYERHIETIVARHLAAFGETLDGAARRTRGVPIVLIGPDEMRSEFEELLAHETRARIAGWTTAEAHADAPQLLEAAMPLVSEWCARRDADLLDRWREEAGRNGRAVSGWDATLEAASDGRVELLLVQDGTDREAYRCPACGRAQITDGACPLDGTTMEPCVGGLDLAVHQTLNHGGTVRVIADRRDLEPVGGVAALLRF
jgi:peptide chain release factor subunit 1